MIRSFRSYRQNQKPKAGFVSGFLKKTRDAAHNRTWGAAYRRAQNEGLYTIHGLARQMNISPKRAKELEKQGIFYKDKDEFYGLFNNKKIPLYKLERQEKRYKLHKKAEKNKKQPEVAYREIKDYLAGDISDYEIKKRRKQGLIQKTRKPGMFEETKVNPFEAEKNIIAFKEGMKKGEKGPKKLIEEITTQEKAA